MLEVMLIFAIVLVGVPMFFVAVLGIIVCLMSKKLRGEEDEDGTDRKKDRT